MAIVTWYYKADEDAKKQLDEDMKIVVNRYNSLKKQMLDADTIKGIREAKMKRIRKFLEAINANLDTVTDDNKLLQYLSSGMTEGAKKAIDKMNEVLENLAATSSVLSDKNVLSDSRQEKLDAFLENLGSLLTLLEQGKKNGMVSYDYNALAFELNKIEQTLRNSPNQVMEETGNVLGHIGAQGAVPYIVQKSVSSIMKELVPNDKIFSSRVQIFDTGKAKTSVRKQTVTTDTLLMAIDPNSEIQVKATLTISDKFNAKYKRDLDNTGAPIKLATRNVRNFVQDVKESSIENGDDIATAYENAITNFLSYHTNNFPLTEKDHQRIDFTKEYKEQWKQLRQAIGAEMMHHEIYIGKGSFNYNGKQFNDLIDISFYGGKLYLASDILNTINTRKRNNNNFNLAQIPVSQARQKFMTSNAAPNVLPKRFVIEAYREGLGTGEKKNYPAGQKAGEKVVGLVLETATMSYSQRITFS